MSGSDSPTFFHGQPWSSWIERIGRDKPLSKCAKSVHPPHARSRDGFDGDGRRRRAVPNLTSTLLCQRHRGGRATGTLFSRVSRSRCRRESTREWFFRTDNLYVNNCENEGHDLVIIFVEKEIIISYRFNTREILLLRKKDAAFPCKFDESCIAAIVHVCEM